MRQGGWLVRSRPEASLFAGRSSGAEPGQVARLAELHAVGSMGRLHAVRDWRAV